MSAHMLATAEIGEHLRRTTSVFGDATGERFERQEFVRRVAEVESVEEPAAAYHA
jgi:hypothetical protein